MAPPSMVQAAESPWLGVIIADAPNGARVIEVINGSPAEDAGVVVGDVVVAIEGKKTRSANALIGTVQTFRVGDLARISVIRAGAAILLEAVFTAKLSEAEILARRLIDRELPGFNMSSLGGASGDSDDHRGDVAVLYFVGAGCRSCTALTTDLEALYAGYKKDGLLVVGVTDVPFQQLPTFQSASAGKLKNSAIKSSIGLPLLADVGNTYRVQTLRAPISPLVIVTDRSRHVRYVAMGKNVDKKLVREAALRALREPIL